MVIDINTENTGLEFYYDKIDGALTVNKEIPELTTKLKKKIVIGSVESSPFLKEGEYFVCESLPTYERAAIIALLLVGYTLDLEKEKRNESTD